MPGAQNALNAPNALNALNAPKAPNAPNAPNAPASLAPVKQTAWFAVFLAPAAFWHLAEPIADAAPPP
ncbi:hypothetical protein EDM54_06225 [Brevibacillus borstelensis]|nr:hypothetical protein EDM54_06225 [Brevibacillus borstelensis]